VSPKTLFVEPLAILPSNQIPPSTPINSTKVRKYNQLLSGLRLYVFENINKRLDIISHPWEVSTRLQNLSQRITSLTEYLKKYLEHVEVFYNNEVKNLIAWVTNLNDHHKS
jgi:hypothetical protein